MKKIILLALTILIIAACGVKKDANGQIAIDTGYGNNPEIIIIDSCEYVSWGYRLAHKGNCRFCKERRQKELKELLEQLK